MGTPPLTWQPAPDLRSRAVAGFRSRHGTEPLAVGRAPGRVNLIGDHTDYLGGLCLPLALPHSTWVAWSPREDRTRVFTSAGHPEHTCVAGARAPGWAAYADATLDALGHSAGAMVHVESNVPVGAGLSSSAALICATAVAVSDAAGVDLLAPCIRAEQEGVGAPTGGLDQTIALLAVPDHALLLDFTTGQRTPVPWRPAASAVELVVVDTGTRHSHAAGGYAGRRAEGERAVRDPGSTDPVLVRRRRHVRSESQRVRDVVDALGREDWPGVGALLTASHESLRDDYEVSCPELDVTVSAALAGGAWGARMTGGGFGGCALVLVPTRRREEALASVVRAFARHGWSAPLVLHTTGGTAAARVWDLPLTAER